MAKPPYVKFDTPKEVSEKVYELVELTRDSGKFARARTRSRSWSSEGMRSSWSWQRMSIPLRF